VQIAATCDELGADLLLIGSRGLGPVRRLVLGSVSEGVVHRAACPTLVLRGGAGAWPPTRVIVGDDGSDEALAAATLAGELAELVGAQLTVARALPQPPEAAQLNTVARLNPVAQLSPAVRDVLIVSVEEQVQERLCRLSLGEATQTSVVVAIDDPVALLLGIAEAEATPALLAVGSRGLGFIDRLRLGSVSTKVLHAAHCPILVVPEQKRSSVDPMLEPNGEQ
jgi:nucleotide-binding universal stress UspA family protein